MIDALSLTLSLNINTECRNELSKHRMNKKITMFEIFDQFFMLLLFGDVKFCFSFEYRENEKCSHIS